MSTYGCSEPQGKCQIPLCRSLEQSGTIDVASTESIAIPQPSEDAPIQFLQDKMKHYSEGSQPSFSSDSHLDRLYGLDQEARQQLLDLRRRVQHWAEEEPGLDLLDRKPWFKDWGWVSGQEVCYKAMDEYIEKLFTRAAVEGRSREDAISQKMRTLRWLRAEGDSVWFLLKEWKFDGNLQVNVQAIQAAFEARTDLITFISERLAIIHGWLFILGKMQHDIEMAGSDRLSDIMYDSQEEEESQVMYEIMPLTPLSRRSKKNGRKVG